jgi:hypothetical protein
MTDHNHEGHQHHHHATSEGLLLLTIAMNVVITVAEIAGGIISGKNPEVKVKKHTCRAVRIRLLAVPCSLLVSCALAQNYNLRNSKPLILFSVAASSIILNIAISPVKRESSASIPSS